MGLVLESHTTTLIQFMVEMQMRVARAEWLLTEVAFRQRTEGPQEISGKATRSVAIPESVLQQIDALLAGAKARTP